MSVNQNLFFSAMFTILFLSMATSYVYAQTLDEGASWKIIFLSDKSSCTVYQEHEMKEVLDLTEKYFEMNEVENHFLDYKCVFSAEYDPSSISNDADLYILMFDEQIGKELFFKYGYEGMYSHFGSDRMKNHVIMIAKSPQFSSAYEYTEFSWSLSEKISHFILSYQGHNLESIERLTHSSELEYSDCVNKPGNVEKCKEIKSTIHSDISGDDLSVMTPVNEIIKKNSLKNFSNDLYSAHTVKKLLREITGWWIDGSINDEQYLKSIKQIVDVSISENKVISIDQLFIPNGFSILDKTLKAKKENQIEGIFTIPSKHEIYQILEYVPFDTDAIKLESENSEIPTWFKNRAMLWHDMKLGDRIFFDGLNALISNGAIQEN
ncbi:MAG: hypothetical protein ACE5DU_03235 [Nitrosopumilus sp.]